ncbi:MAG: hypothetical protein ABFD20_10740 [Anaerolineales bacterium]
MLCPRCETSAPGGTICPNCGEPVPERETFGGQGRHYFWVLALLSVVLFGLVWIIAAFRVGLAQAWHEFWHHEYSWVYALLCLAPLATGIYYWFLLRDEETIVTDEYIERRSHWGNQRLEWKQATGFYQQLLPFRQTKLGRIAGLSHVLVDSKIIAKLPPHSYEITTTGLGDDSSFVIEPGTVSDLPWLLKLISDKLGPPQIV